MPGGSEATSRKPTNSAFKQQKLKAWQPILTPKWVIGTFMLVGIIFIPIGVLILVASSGVSEKTIAYSESIECKLATTDDQDCDYKNCKQNQKCDKPIKFELDEDMEGKVYVYYELENFYQNHRRYVKSRSDQQLRGDASKFPTDSDPALSPGCDPDSSTFVHVPKGYFEKADQSEADRSKETCKDPDQCKKLWYYPCGLIALSKFNDVFKIYKANDAGDDLGVPVEWSNKDIAWESDLNEKFKLPGNGCKWMEENCANKVKCAEDGTGTPVITTRCTDNVEAQVPTFATCEERSSRVEESPFAVPSVKLDTCDGTERTQKAPGCKYDIATEKPFHQIADNRKYYCWQDVKDPDFVVWMRTAGLPTFKKLHRIIPEGVMKKGTYFLEVNSRYNVKAFKGKKNLVLSTVSWVGGKNNFLGGAYCAVGALCLLLGTVFTAKHLVSPRPLGDQRYLVWKQ